MNRPAQLGLLLLAAALFVPFVAQAFHIDDRIYLEIADNILREPLYPYDYPAVFEGISAPDAASHSHLPLTSYYISLIRWASGSDAEWPYHVAFLLFPLLAVFGFRDLALRYSDHPTATALLLASSPVFLLLGHTLMPDVPLLAFWILAVARSLRILDGKGRRRDWIVLVLCLLGASFISLLAGGLLLLLGAVAILRKREGGAVSWRPWVLLLALPGLLWTLWYLRAYWHYDRFVLVNTLLHMSKRDAFDWTLFGVKVVSFVLNLGAVFLCPLAIWYGFSGTVRSRVAVLVFLVSFLPLYLFASDWAWVHKALLGLFLGTGLLVVWEFFLLLKERETHLRLLALWFFGIFAAALLLFYAGSARYTLLALPPALLAWSRRLELRFPEPYFRRNLVWVAVVLTLLYSVPLSLADYHFAGVYREAARSLVTKYSHEGSTIWFTGEWGFRYYFEKEGARLIRRVQAEAKPGDIIVKPFLATPWVTLYDGNEMSTLLEQNKVKPPLPLRLQDFASRAGFYSTAWGLLPVSLSTGTDWEWFNVFRVDKPFEGPVPEEEQHW